MKHDEPTCSIEREQYVRKDSRTSHTTDCTETQPLRTHAQDVRYASKTLANAPKTSSETARAISISNHLKAHKFGRHFRHSRNASNANVLKTLANALKTLANAPQTLQKRLRHHYTP